MQGTRHNTNKALLSLVPLEGMEAFARAGEFGITKYDRDNWKKGLPLSEIMDSLLRHAGKVSNSNGTAIDEESGLNHIDHVVWNAIAFAYGLQHGWDYLRPDEVGEPYNDDGVIKVSKTWWDEHSYNYFMLPHHHTKQLSFEDLGQMYSDTFHTAFTFYHDSLRFDNKVLDLTSLHARWPDMYRTNPAYFIAKHLAVQLKLGRFRAIQFDNPIQV